MTDVSMTDLSPAVPSPDVPASTEPAVTLVFVATGLIVILAALAGVAWGVPTLMVWPEDDAAG